MREREFLQDSCLKEISDVIAVEQNDDMRAKLIGLQDELKNLKVLSGTAENTLLENKSIDFVTVAQAFHWFDAENLRRNADVF